MMRGTSQPRATPKQGSKKFADPRGALTAFTRSKRWAASSTPLNEPVTRVVGIVKASTRKLRRVSSERSWGMWKTWRTKMVVRHVSVAQPTTPRRAWVTTAVHTMEGILSSLPEPSASATYLVAALPHPRSKRLKYPTTAQANESTPKRDAPKLRTRNGIETTAMASGSACP